MISVLCVNYRSSADVFGLAASLAEHRGGEAIELIVVNHSPRERVALPDSAIGFSRVIEQSNVGYAAGINRAASLARGEWLFLANPDVRITRETLRVARRALEENADIGVLLPLLRHPDGSVQASVRRFYTWPVALYARLPLRRIWRPAFFRRYLCEDLDRSGPADVDWGLGGAMFVRRDDHPGGRVLDERFFLYFEDVDLCWRTWQRGRRVVYWPQAECVHAHRRRSAAVFNRHGWHHFRSFLRFVSKHGGLPGRPAR